MSLSAGERVPADLRLIEAQDLFVSQALLTGESNVLEKNTNRLASATQIPLDRFSNIAFMGSSVISGEERVSSWLWAAAPYMEATSPNSNGTSTALIQEQIRLPGF